MTDIESWVKLSRVPGMGGLKMRRLVSRFGSPEAVFKAELPELLKVPNIEPKVAKSIRKEGVDLQKDLEFIHRYKIKVISFQDPSYPANLKPFPISPPLLYVRGDILDEDCKAVAIVGSRRATPYGKLMAERFGRELAEAGITVVSGMARGIDTAAHGGAIKAGGRTIAVLGCGLDIVYPPENRTLMEKITTSGAVVSEFPLGTRPFAGNFPKRNRIISGLSLGIVAVEASLDSGVFSTVRWAAEQGRDVFAIPGDVNRRTSVGTNKLISEGAKLTTCIEDVLEELHLALPGKEKPPPQIELTERERSVYDLLSYEPTYIDQVAEGAQLAVSEVSSLLLSLELKGAVKQVAGKRFIKEVDL